MSRNLQKKQTIKKTIVSDSESETESSDSEYSSQSEQYESEEEKNNVAKINETNELSQIFFERMAEGFDDFNILLVGRVSSGKSTLLNALLGDQYSESQIQKTTKGISLYLTNHNNYTDAQTIFETNKNKIINEKSKNVFFDIHKVKNDKLTNQIKIINIFDTPGIDDPDSYIDELTCEWIYKNSKFVDLFVIVIDIEKTLTTRSDENSITEIIKKCNGDLLFFVNKFDDSDNPEYDSLYDNFTQKINNIMKKNNKNYTICKGSALYEYIFKCKSNGNFNKLSSKHKNMSQFITSSGLQSFYDNLELYTKSTNLVKKHLFNYLNDDILKENGSINDLFEILNEYISGLCFNNKENFTDEEIDKLAEYIYNANINETQSNIFQDYPNLQKIFDFELRLRCITIEKTIFSGDYNYEKIINAITKTTEPNSRNMILKFVLDKETENIKKTSLKSKDIKRKKTEFKSFESNQDHLDKIISYGELISLNDKLNILNDTVISYVNYIVVSNILCDTVSLPNSYDNMIKYTNNKNIYKIALYFLLWTNDYAELFDTYKELTKLRYVDGDIRESLGVINKNCLVDIQINKLSNDFKYLEIIKNIHTYIKQQKKQT